MHRCRFVLLLIVFIASACRPQVAVPQSPTVTVDPPASVASPLPSTPSPVATATIEASPSPTIQPSPTLSPSPTPQPSPTPAPRTTLLFTGVIVPARCVQAAIDEYGDTEYIYDDVRQIISGADLAVGTLNATMSDYPPHKGCVPTYVLVGSSGNADAMQRAGFDVMSVATNHIKNCGVMNCGDRAFFDTLDNLERVGILAVGAGANHAEAMQPVVVTVNGVRFGIVSLGQIEQTAFAGEDTPGIAVLNPENLKAAIAAARQVSDVVIAMPHWGPEDVPWPNYIQRDLAQQLVDAGADLVVGNHTHVVQAIQEIDGVPVFYGLGNFVFDQGLRDHQQGVILKVYYKGDRYAGFDLIPTHVNRDGRVFVAALDEAAEVLERVRLASQPLGMQEWQPEYIANLPEADLAGLSQEEITRQLFEQWLDYSVSPVLPNSARIGVYEIESISVDESQQEQASELGMDWLAEVVFAVRPVVPTYTDWVSGSGELTPDGWVRQKSLLVGVSQGEGRYWMKILDTGL
jgi:poly-gamma-glutamate capsule biosynthesis protein CapA/YwtB (metallophosphatase superfamily)